MITLKLWGATKSYGNGGRKKVQNLRGPKLPI